jgi:ferric-dicitrate binding protein FerR (iron transport regulator)
MRCLAKRPGDRFASMADLGRAAAALRRRPEAAPADEPHPIGSSRRGGQKGLLIAAAVLLVIAIAVIAALVAHERKHADDVHHDGSAQANPANPDRP